MQSLDNDSSEWDAGHHHNQRHLLKFNKVVFSHFAIIINFSWLSWKRQTLQKRISQKNRIVAIILICWYFHWNRRTIGVDISFTANHRWGRTDKKRLSGHKFAYYLAPTVSGLDTLVAFGLPINHETLRGISWKKARPSVQKSVAVLLWIGDFKCKCARHSHDDCSPNRLTDRLFVNCLLIEVDASNLCAQYGRNKPKYYIFSNGLLCGVTWLHNWRGFCWVAGIKKTEKCINFIILFYLTRQPTSVLSI